MTNTKPSGVESANVTRPTWRRAPLFVLLGSLLLHFFRFGYDYANSDQDEVLPFLLHRLDPSFFTQDWFVQTQTAEISVRTYSVWILESLSLFFPVWLATLLSFVGTWLVIAGAVYALAFLFSEDRLASAASVVVALVFTPMWTLGGNDLVHTMMVPSMLGWGLGLWAIYHFLLGRYLLSPVLLGMACWIHALVGLQVATLLFLYRLSFLFSKEKGPNTPGGVIAFFVLFLLYASPALGPLIYQQFTTPPTEAYDAPSLYYIMAAFRMSHHYLLYSFSMPSVLRFGVLVVVGLSVLLYPRIRRRLRFSSFIIRGLIIIGLGCLVGFVFTEVFPVLVLAKFQLFKLTVVAKLLFVILISHAVFVVLPMSVRKPLDTLLKYPYWGLAVTLVFLTIVVLNVTNGPLRDFVGPFARANQPIGKVEQWAKTETPHDAIFAVPPSFSSFRSGSHRTIVVNFKSVPFTDRDLVTWFERLTDLAPITLPDRGGPAVLKALDEEYNRIPADTLIQLRDKYGFHYVVREQPLDENQTVFDRIFEVDPWIVYQVRNTESDV